MYLEIIITTFEGQVVRRLTSVWSHHHVRRRGAVAGGRRGTVEPGWAGPQRAVHPHAMGIIVTSLREKQIFSIPRCLCSSCVKLSKKLSTAVKGQTSYGYQTIVLRQQ